MDLSVTVKRVLPQLNSNQDIDTVMQVIVGDIQANLGYKHIGIYLFDEKSGHYLLVAGTIDRALVTLPAQFHEWVISEPDDILVIDPTHRSGVSAIQDGLRELGVAQLAVGKLRVGHTYFGLLVVMDAAAQKKFDETRLQIVRVYVQQVAMIIYNLKLLEETELRLKRLSALRTIEMTVSGSLDLKTSLSIMLEQGKALLGVDAACVLVYSPHSLELEYTAGQGFQGKSIRNHKVKLGEDLAGTAAVERRTVGGASMLASANGFRRSVIFEEEKFVAYYAAPLVAKGELKGVLEVFNRNTLMPDTEWHFFLEILARQVANVIQEAEVFRELQRYRFELSLAYDAMIEKWVQSYEERIFEPQGHTSRVAELTLQVARLMGFNERDLVNIRRGAYLHDVGKIYLPESILGNPGPLNAYQQLEIRKHPVYAYELLSTTDVLRDVLDIPYCHHENWDGSGYPRGLSGEQIPISARIFAVVENWDILRVDRPYRKAWSDEQIKLYMRDQAGHKFDQYVIRKIFEIL